MSDHGTAHEPTTRPGPVVVLTDDEIERALGRTVERGRGLVRRRNQRRAAVGILGAAALLAGGFGIISSLSDDSAGVVVTPAGRTGGEESGPASSTTTAAPAPTPTGPGGSSDTEVPVPGAPPGFTRTELADGLVRIDNDAPVEDARVPAPTVTLAGGGSIDIGTAAAEVPAATVTGSERIDDHTLRLRYECDPTTTYLGSVTYRLDGDVVRAQVQLQGITPDPCDGAVDLFFPDTTLPVDVRAETARFDG